MNPPNVNPRPILPKLEPGVSPASYYLDTFPDESTPKRRCISSACMPCRRRKSKCDGQKPSCNACTSVYGSNCVYDIDSDHRRKGALKRDIRALTDQKAGLITILDAIRDGSEFAVDNIVHMIRFNREESYEAISQMIKMKCLEGSISEPAPEGERGGIAANFYEKIDQTGGTSDLSLMGFYGEPPALAVERFGRWTSVTDDSNLIKHLFDLYFTWSHPFYVLFSEEVFYHGLNENKLKYCSPLLVNAILAFGCSYSDRQEARADPTNPRTVGDHFFAEAKRLLDADHRSSLTTVAALGIMSIRQSMKNNSGSGWKYLGQMMSMSADLGLHMSYTAFGGNRIMTATESEARRVTFWGVYAVETICAMCTGRISFLPRTAVMLEKPFPNSNLEGKIWRPHGHPQLADPFATLEQPSFTYNLSQQVGHLTEIINDAVFIRHAPREYVAGQKLLQLHERYEGWHQNLPECLAVKRSSPTLPQVISLHIFYHSCLIHLFRPFLKTPLMVPAKSPQIVCTEAAIALSNLLDLYKNTYGFRYPFLVTTHATMTAAIQHLIDMSSAIPAIAAQASLYLRDAILALHEMRQSIFLSPRYLKGLGNLVKTLAPNPPEHVSHALAEAGVDPHGPSHNADPVKIPSPHLLPVGLQKYPSPAPLEVPDIPFKHGAPEQQLPWSPFPNALDATPLAAPTAHADSHNMDMSTLLASGLNSDLAQMNPEGILVDPTSIDEEPGIWSLDWNLDK